jgi:hypothetical protein
MCSIRVQLEVFGAAVLKISEKWHGCLLGFHEQGWNWIGLIGVGFTLLGNWYKRQNVWREWLGGFHSLA